MSPEDISYIAIIFFFNYWSNRLYHEKVIGSPTWHKNNNGQTFYPVQCSRYWHYSRQIFEIWYKNLKGTANTDSPSAAATAFDPSRRVITFTPSLCQPLGVSITSCFRLQVLRLYMSLSDYTHTKKNCWAGQTEAEIRTAHFLISVHPTLVHCQSLTTPFFTAHVWQYNMVNKSPSSTWLHCLMLRHSATNRKR